METKHTQSTGNTVEQPGSTPEEIWRHMQETARLLHKIGQRQEETDRQLAETDKQVRATSKEVKETGKQLKKLETEFTSRWGKLVESLVEGKLIELLHGCGIKVTNTITRIKAERQGNNYEFDIIAHNGEEVVIVEVKTTLRLKDVKKFVRVLSEFKRVVSVYNDRKVYGAMAYIRDDSAAARKAEKSGLIIIRALGDSAHIKNAVGFKPREW